MGYTEQGLLFSDQDLVNFLVAQRTWSWWEERSPRRPHSFDEMVNRCRWLPRYAVLEVRVRVLGKTPSSLPLGQQQQQIFCLALEEDDRECKSLGREVVPYHKLQSLSGREYL